MTRQERLQVIAVLHNSRSSCPLPDSVSRTLARSLQTDSSGERELTRAQVETIDRAAGREDSNEDVVATVGAIDIVADGFQVVDVVLDGLLRRLQFPLDEGEKLVLEPGVR